MSSYRVRPNPYNKNDKWVDWGCFNNPSLADVRKAARKNFQNVPEGELEISGTVPESIILRKRGVRKDEKLMLDLITKYGIE